MDDFTRNARHAALAGGWEGALLHPRGRRGDARAGGAESHVPGGHASTDVRAAAGLFAEGRNPRSLRRCVARWKALLLRGSDSRHGPRPDHHRRELAVRPEEIVRLFRLHLRTGHMLEILVVLDALILQRTLALF